MKVGHRSGAQIIIEGDKQEVRLRTRSSAHLSSLALFLWKSYYLPWNEHERIPSNNSGIHSGYRHVAGSFPLTLYHFGFAIHHVNNEFTNSHLCRSFKQRADDVLQLRFDSFSGLNSPREYDTINRLKISSFSYLKVLFSRR